MNSARENAKNLIESLIFKSFGSEGDTHTVVVDIDDGLEHLSNEDLQRFLDERQGSSGSWLRN